MDVIGIHVFGSGKESLAMEKIVRISVYEAMNLRDSQDKRVINIIEALKGSFADKPYRLSYAGVLHKDKGGHTEVDILNQELFIRLSKAEHAAQEQFLEGVEGWIGRERTSVLIEVEWGLDGKKRNLSASIDEALRPRRLILNLA